MIVIDSRMWWAGGMGNERVMGGLRGVQPSATAKLAPPGGAWRPPPRRLSVSILADKNIRSSPRSTPQSRNLEDGERKSARGWRFPPPEPLTPRREREQRWGRGSGLDRLNALARATANIVRADQEIVPLVLPGAVRRSSDSQCFTAQSDRSWFVA